MEEKVIPNRDKEREKIEDMIIMEEKVITQKIINENNDKLEIGTAGKGGSIRVSGNFNNPEEFKKRIDNAIEVRKYANAKISINI